MAAIFWNRLPEAPNSLTELVRHHAGMFPAKEPARGFLTVRGVTLRRFYFGWFLHFLTFSLGKFGRIGPGVAK
jgi:hypothetical protein